VSIDVNCVFEGKVSLGDGVRIGPNCVLRDAEVAAGSEILAFSMLDHAQVGARCRVGPYSRLRPGASLAEDVHIGNFVEVKASRFGAGSKANHLSYIGDSTSERASTSARHDHLQLRRRRKAPHRDRGRLLHRLRHDARRPGAHRERLAYRRRLDDQQGHAARPADRGPRPAGSPCPAGACGRKRSSPCVESSALPPSAISSRC
jgi:hypothetical protein